MLEIVFFLSMSMYLSMVNNFIYACLFLCLCASTSVSSFFLAVAVKKVSSNKKNSENPFDLWPLLVLHYSTRIEYDQRPESDKKSHQIKRTLTIHCGPFWCCTAPIELIVAAVAISTNHQHCNAMVSILNQPYNHSL